MCAQSYPTLSDPLDCNPPTSSVYGICQTRILEWVVISFSGGSSQPRDQIWVSCISGRFFTNEPQGSPSDSPSESESEVAQSCPTLCDPMDCSPPGSSVHGILQARILEWVAISFSRCLPDPGIKPRSPALQADTLTSDPPGKPIQR